MKIIKKIYLLLSPSDRKRAFTLLILILFMAFFEMIGVASILPFISILTNPSLVDTNTFLKSLFEVSFLFGVKNNQEFLFFLGLITFILLLTSLTIKIITIYYQIRFVQAVQHSLSKRLVEIYLKQPYSWFLNNHSADFGKTILHEIGMITGNGINPLIELIAKGAITITILCLLIISNPPLALVVGSTLSISYLLIFKSSKKYIQRLGKERLSNNKKRFISISEAFGAIKEIKINGLENTYINRFANPNLSMAKNIATSSTIEKLPRFFVEAIAFGGIILLILYLMAQTGSFNQSLPIISLYAFAGYRLIPALQIIYTSFSKFVFAGPSVDQIYKDLTSLKKFDFSFDKEILEYNKIINLRNINYYYPKATKTAIKNINLSIHHKTTVGFVGATGSGKTTTVDIILGLLEPQSGTLEVDGKIISNTNVRAWRKLIGYVPQFIYLSDDTIAANIAFGANPEEINLKTVERVSKIANLHDFVINDLPNKYQTTIGERGVRLSGGQRQRIGIARALYHNPQILILDEATNSLDSYTEKAVMDAVSHLNQQMTIIIIAHRLNTLSFCDKIFYFEKGELKNQGSFDELIKVSETFELKDNIKN